MDRSFDVGNFISRIGERLVMEFSDAKSATSPTAVGDAMENPVREQLEQILPHGIAVGSGFVIDSYGRTSQQTDVVLYEREICPVFSINNTPEATYYPCEGVIAVGQVKSIFNRSRLEEEFKKIASVKRLQRFPVYHPIPHPNTGAPLPLERNYGVTQTPSVIDARKIEQSDCIRQVFGFILGGEVNLKPSTLMNEFVELTKEIGEGYSPNLAVFLDHGQLQWGTITTRRTESGWMEDTQSFGLRERYDGPATWNPSRSAVEGDVLYYSNNRKPFSVLIRKIFGVYTSGKTSDISAFDRYLLKGDDSPIDQVAYLPKNGMTLDHYLETKTN